MHHLWYTAWGASSVGFKGLGSRFSGFQGLGFQGFQGLGLAAFIIHFISPSIAHFSICTLCDPDPDPDPNPEIQYVDCGALEELIVCRHLTVSKHNAKTPFQ